MSLRDINPFDMRLTTLESLAFARMIDKRERYVEAGRTRDAHGLGMGIWILWQTLISEPVQQDTGLADL
jgi:hypothetical protein